MNAETEQKWFAWRCKKVLHNNLSFEVVVDRKKGQCLSLNDHCALAYLNKPSFRWLGALTA